MKYKKLPTLNVTNGLTFRASVGKKFNIFSIFIKTILLCSLILSLVAGAYYLNIKYTEYVYTGNRVSEETSKALNMSTGIVIDATTAIISREGNISTPLARKYAVWIYESGLKYKVDPVLIMSVMSVESKFDYKAVSPTGPIGLLQVAYSWHKEKTTQVGLFDPKNNIDVGTRIIKEYSDKSSSDIETLLRFNGSLGQSPIYAVKVLGKKSKYNQEIVEAIVKSI